MSRAFRQLSSICFILLFVRYRPDEVDVLTKNWCSNTWSFWLHFQLHCPGKILYNTRGLQLVFTYAFRLSKTYDLHFVPSNL